MTVHRKPAYRKPAHPLNHAPYFFEVAGQPSILHLNKFYFGGTGRYWADEEQDIDGVVKIDTGHSSTTYLKERIGPLYIFPAKHSPLFTVIYDYFLRKDTLPVCSMGTYSPTSEKGTITKTTKYRLITPTVVNYTRFGGIESFTIKYPDIKIFYHK